MLLFLFPALFTGGVDFSGLFCFNTKSSVRHGSQSLFRDQLAGLPANAVHLVFDPDLGIFQVLDQLSLPGRKGVEPLGLQCAETIVQTPDLRVWIFSQF